ncbi:hypothetical protein ACVIGB_007192 [Bradyrhizobium sp. USDA 4341]
MTVMAVANIVVYLRNFRNRLKTDMPWVTRRYQVLEGRVGMAD